LARWPELSMTMNTVTEEGESTVVFAQSRRDLRNAAQTDELRQSRRFSGVFYGSSLIENIFALISSGMVSFLEVRIGKMFQTENPVIRFPVRCYSRTTSKLPTTKYPGFSMCNNQSLAANQQSVRTLSLTGILKAF
jgi:hypothetical protein